MTEKNHDLVVIANAAAGQIGRRGDTVTPIRNLVEIIKPWARIYDGISPADRDLVYDEIVSSRPSVVAVAGGDGTVHHALTGIWRACRGRAELMPDLLIVPVGTMNVVASQFGMVEEAPLERLTRLAKSVIAGEKLPRLEIDTIEVNGEVGFMYGSGIPVSLLRAYYEMPGVPFVRIALVVSQAILGFLDTPQLTNAGRIVDAQQQVILQKWSETRGIIAGTIRDLSRDLLVLPPISAPGRFALRVCNTALYQLALNINDLKQGTPLPDVIDFEPVRASFLFESPTEYMIDGDIKPPQQVHRLSIGPRVRLIA